jgi:single-stranded-DNA-specific exonuclease
MIKDWNIKIDGRDMDEVEIIDALLESRGIKDVETFLYPNADGMVPFDEMQGLEEGCNIVLGTIENGGKFVVHFDVDVDGNASGSIMTRYLSHYTSNITTVTNMGKEHGVQNFDLALLDKETTLIVVDSLNNNPSVYERIIGTGASLIVLDHHIIEPALTSANLNFCLISSANNYPNPALSGAGVVLKFCQYIDSVTWNDYADEYWDIAAAGIIADMCNISESSPENRYICSMGFNNQKNLAISKINGSFGFDAKAVSFGLAPLVNAACRMNENEKAMKLFISDDQKEINAIVKDLKKCKEAQNNIVNDQMGILIEQGEQQLNQRCMYFFINADGEVAGLLGNKLLEKYQRPLFVLRQVGDNYCGSMRAIGVENFAQMVNDTGIGQCMGHELAAGAIIPVDKFEEFKAQIEKTLKDVEFKQTIDIDIQLDEEQITDTLIQSIKDINKISGSGFPPITVMIGEVSDYTVGNMSNGKHLKIMGQNVTFIKWNFTGWDDLWDLEDKEFYGVGQLDSGFFGRTYYRQLILSDFKFEDIW